MGIPRYLAVGVALGTLAACGGGGGGGGGGGSSSDTPLQYSGNTNAAAITTSNASTLAGNVMGGGDVATATAAISGGTEVSVGQGLVDVGRRLIHTFRATLTQRSDGASRLISVLVDQTEPCTNGGTVRIFGDVTPSGTGTVNVTYTNCTEDVDSISGSATMRIDNAANILGDIVFTDYTISYNRLRMRGSVNADISGSVRVLADIPTNRETATENMVTLNNVTGRMTKSENLVFEDTYDDLSNPSTYTELVSGRVFDSIHGFVDITTSIELRFPFLTQPFPSGGELVLTGAGNGRIRVTANSLTMVTLGLDLDGNGVFERQARLAWTNLQPNSIAADLGDNDGDGMHNSWETAFGLNPNLPDAAADSDGDGFSNLVEYGGGSHPLDSGSTPIPTVGAAFPAASNIAVANSNMEVPGQSAIAFDGTNYLLVSCRQVGPSPGVFGVLISLSGGVLSNFLISSDPCPQRPAVAFDGSNYLVALSRGSQIFGVRVTPGAVVLDGAGFAISSIADGSTNFFPAVAFDGTNYLVVWRKFLSVSSRIHAARVQPNGTVLPEFAVTSGPGGLDAFPMLSFDGTNYLAVWTSGSSGSEDVSGAFVSPSGMVAAPFGIATLANSQFVGGVAFDGANYLVVWDHTANTSLFPPPDGQIFGRRVAPNGALLDGTAASAGIPISTGAFANHSSSVAFAGRSYLVTWAVGSFPNSPPAGIFAVRISTGGVRLDGPPGTLGFALGGAPTTFARFVHPVAVAGGQNALIAWVNNIELSGTEKDILAAPVFGP